MFTPTFSRFLAASAAISLSLSPLATATYFHVSTGCITYLNTYGAMSTYCQSCSPLDISDGHITVWAGYPDDHTSETVLPSLKGEFSWPSAYGDVYFGGDNCLYDSSGAIIDGQCAGPLSYPTSDYEDPGYGGAAGQPNPYLQSGGCHSKSRLARGFRA